jgi:hypothetical protein
MNLQPIRDLCTKSPTAESWLQDCFSELIAEAVKHKAYDSVEAINQLLGLLLPGAQQQEPPADPQPPQLEEAITEAVVVDVTGQPRKIDWGSREYRAAYRERILAILSGWAEKQGDHWLSALKLIPAVERHYMANGEFQIQPRRFDETHPSYLRDARPWRIPIGEVIRGLVGTGLIEGNGRSYRLAQHQRQAITGQ